MTEPANQNEKQSSEQKEKTGQSDYYYFDLCGCLLVVRADGIYQAYQKILEGKEDQ